MSIACQKAPELNLDIVNHRIPPHEYNKEMNSPVKEVEVLFHTGKKNLKAKNQLVIKLLDF